MAGGVGGVVGGHLHAKPVASNLKLFLLTGGKDASRSAALVIAKPFHFLSDAFEVKLF